MALNKSKSAISLDLTHLEQRVGRRLCVRGRSGFKVTGEGQIVYLAALQLFADVEKFRDSLASAMGALTGQVRLLLIDNLVSVSAGPMAQALRNFTRQHPLAGLVLESATPAGVEQGILEGGADLGVSVLPREMSAIEAIPIFREELRLYAGKDHVLARQSLSDLGIDDLVQHRLVRPGVASDPVFARLLERFPSSSRAGNIDTRMLLALSGEHLSVMPPHYAAPWVERGELIEIRPDLVRTENTFYILFKKSARQPAAARAFLSILLDAFGKNGKAVRHQPGQLP